MQVKPSYRALKWTLSLVGIAASLGACVVTEGDGGDDDAFGGESGSTSTAGTSSTAGTTGTAGTNATGGTGGTSTGGTAAGGAPDGAGGEAYIPGLCEADAPTPSVEPSCALVPKDDDAGRECVKCMKSKCCSEWKTCFGSAPTTACGFGPTASGDGNLGQFECIIDCFDKNATNETDPDTLLDKCGMGCNNQCEDVDMGFPLDSTNALVECANKPANCQADCFPFE